MLFDQPTLENVLSLQEKSYGLLKWVGASLESATLSFRVVHDATNTAGAAAEWLRRNRESLPKAFRPDPSELEPFARLFVSYLTTSFDLPGRPARRGRSCGCDCCLYLSYAYRLVLRNPSEKDRSRAHEHKVLCLEAIAEEAGVCLSPEAKEAILENPILYHELSYTSYARELLRRSEFASQGTSVLPLWRSIAWEGGRPKKGFTLTADRVVEAESRVRAALTDAGDSSHATDKLRASAIAPRSGRERVARN